VTHCCWDHMSPDHCTCAAEDPFGMRCDKRATSPAPKLKELADRLAGALFYALRDAHPIYSSTAGWRGGIGGQTITQGCSFNDPPPGEEWLQMDLLSQALREYLAAYPETDIRALALEARERGRAALQ
jgi:hypothetical protein